MFYNGFKIAVLCCFSGLCCLSQYTCTPIFSQNLHRIFTGTLICVFVQKKRDYVSTKSYEHQRFSRHPDGVISPKSNFSF